MFDNFSESFQDKDVFPSINNLTNTLKYQILNNINSGKLINSFSLLQSLELAEFYRAFNIENDFLTQLFINSI